MNTEQSRKLKIGARVCFNGQQTDRGTVTATNARYLTIKWEDGHTSFTSNGDMQRVALLAATR
jgi:hypothetical protein